MSTYITSQIPISATFSFCLIKKHLTKFAIINLHSCYGSWRFLVALANHNGVGGCNLSFLFAYIKWHRVDESFGVFDVVVYGSFIPNFFNSFVVDISKWSKRKWIKVKDKKVQIWRVYYIFYEFILEFHKFCNHESTNFFYENECCCLLICNMYKQ